MSAMDDPVVTEASEDNVIMIISGDRSVLYPVSLLMFRNYTVFLVIPSSDANTQDIQATRVFSWHTDVLRCAPNPEPVSVIPDPLNLSTVNGWIVNGSHIPQLSLDSPSLTRSPQSSVISPRSGQSTHIASPKPMSTVTSPPGTPMSKERSILPSEPSTSRAPSVLSLGFNPRAASRPLESFGATTSTSDRREKTGANKQDFSEPQSRKSANAPKKAETKQSDAAGNWASDDWAAAGGWSAGGSWETAGLNWMNDAPPAPKPANRSKETPSSRRAAPPPKQDTSTSAPQRKPQAQARDSTSRNEAKAPPPRNQAKPAASDPSMVFFDPLVEVLQKSETQSMARSQLGEQLAKRKGLYQLAGVGGFGEYISLAVKKNIVVLSGTDNHQQVKLKRR